MSRFPASRPLSCLLVGLVGAASVALQAAEIIKADNKENLNLGASWLGGTPPGASDVAVWNHGVSGANTTALGANLIWHGVRITDPADAVTIGNSSDVLTLGSAGLDMTGATVDFSYTPSLVLGADQTWDIAGGRVVNVHALNVSHGVSGTNHWTFTNSVGGGDALVSMQPGGTGSVGFNDAGGNREYSGNWIVGSGVVVQNYRNGRTAWGTNNAIILAGGTVGPWQGNWTWTTPIAAQAGSVSTIDNRNTGGNNRYLKLQGAITGAGTLTFADTGAGMNNETMGYILTGSNTFSGTLHVTPDAEVRVGGVGGDSTATGAGTSGTMGTARVVNDGQLTFTRTDAITVPNDISGFGTLRFGYVNFAATGNQVVTLTGHNTWTGITELQTGTVVFGELAAVPAGLSVFAVPSGTTVGVGFPLDQTFLDRIDPGSAGAVALANDSAQPLDCSWFYGSLSLGSIGTNTLAGALTPNTLDGGVTYNYRLGGAGGTLVVNTPLTDYLDTPTGLVICGGGTGGTVILGATNTFTGPVTILGGLVLDPTGHGFGTGNLNLGLYQGSGLFDRALGGGQNQVRVVVGNSGFSSFGGPLTVNLGGLGAILAFDSPDFQPTVLVLNSTPADAPLTIRNGLDLAGFERQIDVGATNPVARVALAAPVSNSAGLGGLTKSGPGVLALEADNEFGGELRLAGGTVSVTREANLGASSDALNFSGGILQIVGTGLSSLGTRTVSWFSFDGGFDIADPANVFTVNESLYGTGTLVKAGPGTLLLGGDNARTGPTTITGGVLRLAHANALAGSAVGVFVDGGLDLNGLDASLGGLIGTGAVNVATQTVTLTPSGANRTYAGTLSGTGKIVLDAPATGVYQVFAGSNSYTFSGTYEVLRSLLIFNGNQCLDGAPALDIVADPTDSPRVSYWAMH